MLDFRLYKPYIKIEIKPKEEEEKKTKKKKKGKQVKKYKRNVDY
jgi:hypothetical protein